MTQNFFSIPGCSPLAGRAASALLLLGLGALLHCSSEPGPDVQSGTAKADAGEPAPNAPDAGGAANDAGRVSTGDGGTVDTGRDAGAIRVCGGAAGNPSAVPVLDWAVYAYPPKYAHLLGTKGPVSEPLESFSTRVIVDGTRAEDSTGTSVGFGGSGLSDLAPGVSKQDFAAAAMPTTDLSFESSRALGWSDTLGRLFEARTRFADADHPHYRVAAQASHLITRTWFLRQPVPRDPAQADDHYVSSFDAARGTGWFFTVLFDAECKATELDALVAGNPISILAPPAPRTREELSQFLVDNDARLSLTVVTFGSEAPGVIAALTGTQASAGTLASLESTLSAVSASLDTYRTNYGPADYESVAAGTNPDWVIGRMITARVPTP